MFEIKGSKVTPFHLSVGIVLVKNNEVLLIKKEDNSFTLPRETMFSNESVEDVLKRGGQEELGFIIITQRFLGSIKSFFLRDGVNIEKTTIYFLCAESGTVQDSKEKDEEKDEVCWKRKDDAREILQKGGNEEFKIIDLI